MKKVIYSLFIILFTTTAFANQYILKCSSDKINFQTVFSVNENTKEIIHLSSKHFDTNQVWDNLNKKLKIIYWLDNTVHTFSISSNDNHNFMSFDLKNYHYINTGHFLDLPDWSYGYAYSQLFKCIKD